MIDYAQGTGPEAPPALTPEMLKRIAVLCRQEPKLALAVTQAEAALRKAKEEYEKLTQDILPGILQEAGVKEIGLDDGWSVKVEDYVSANITTGKKDTVDNRPAAHAWLRANGFGSLVKNNITVTFGMGEDKKAAKLYKELAKKYESVTTDERVHSSTLVSFVKEVLAGKVVVRKKAVSLPESISYVSLPVAKIKEPKAHETRKAAKQNTNPF